MFKQNIFKILALGFIILLGTALYNSNKTVLKNVEKNKQVVISLPQDLRVLLSVNGTPAGSVDMKNDQNQCDVLSEALSQKKIKSLDMRYNKDFKTSVVYQINGIGKKDSVWWGFKVNGKSPEQGCSNIKVKNGDISEWSYLGN